ncbi:MAG: phosphoribosylformylglycinamidine synthase, purS protein [Bacteroidetes bacterium RIFOXYA12_FULL_35_11]|nr:MAG: phosphoribosylformylglycinamidine synthase, purS protein [Bacteroidetes bacterium GWF2_35_48]OFY78690.1 MAG: phosphoribosylformylglycinamidine synthase, purS protein [Bacteroidetes bacterium RIFOXYA12_FULL_35_11]OFY95285.1 MAG: phosphoribosylformylglycinamidine synthase, purS protein [Bacteroidetes bacterium RIFOXYC12_FULL_35_7]HBX53504.1 phosphoribosylformylglycinamidine synthase [Bacteroidales bacterium]
MKFLAEINVMPLKALLDPQGKAVTSTMQRTGYPTVSHVRIGKHITLEIEAENQEDARKILENVCDKMLSNPIMEDYEIVFK